MSDIIKLDKSNRNVKYIRRNRTSPAFKRESKRKRALDPLDNKGAEPGADVVDTPLMLPAVDNSAEEHATRVDSFAAEPDDPAPVAGSAAQVHKPDQELAAAGVATEQGPRGGQVRDRHNAADPHFNAGQQVTPIATQLKTSVDIK